MDMRKSQELILLYTEISKCKTCQELQAFWQSRVNQLRGLKPDEYSKMLDAKSARIFDINYKSERNMATYGVRMHRKKR